MTEGFHVMVTDIPGLLAKIGVPVPDGDTDKLARAARAWNTFATTHNIVDAADTGRDCNSHRDALEGLRATISHITEQLAATLATAVVVPVAATLITAGISEIAGGGAAVAAIGEAGEAIGDATPTETIGPLSKADSNLVVMFSIEGSL